MFSLGEQKEKKVKIVKPECLANYKFSDALVL